MCVCPVCVVVMIGCVWHCCVVCVIVVGVWHCCDHVCPCVCVLCHCVVRMSLLWGVCVIVVTVCVCDLTVSHYDCDSGCVRLMWPFMYFIFIYFIEIGVCVCLLPELLQGLL